MKAFSRISKLSLALLAAVTCLLAAAAVPAAAVPPDQVLLTGSGQILSGECCTAWGDAVKLTEPAKAAPVVVTYSMEYQSGGVFYVGLSVNGGPCTAYGNRSIDPSWLSTFRTATFQWVIKPANGLVPGQNTFSVCGGAAPTNPDSGLILQIRTLAVELGK